MPGGFKGTAFQKNLMGVIYLLSMDSLKIKFFGYLKNKKLLYAHTETTLNGEISTESVYISVNKNTNLKKI
jgi:hypothetical protein